MGFLFAWIYKILENYFTKSEKRKHQNLLAVVIFYRFYLEELLKINDECNDNLSDSTEGSNDSEDSKKKTLETE